MKKGNLARKIIVRFLFPASCGDFIEINAIARGHRGAIAFKEHLFCARLFFSLRSLSAMNYISSQRRDGTVSCIKKIVYRQNSGDKNGYNALPREAVRAGWPRP